MTDVLGLVVLAVTLVAALVAVVVLALQVRSLRSNATPATGAAPQMPPTRIPPQSTRPDVTAQEPAPDRAATSARSVPGSRQGRVAQSVSDVSQEPALDTPQTAPLRALWTLEMARLQRQWSLATAGMSPPPSLSERPTDALLRALAMELDLLRDDVGIPGQLRVRLEEIDATTALVVLRLLQEVLAGLSRSADEVDIVLSEQGETLSCRITFTATGSQELRHDPAVAAAVRDVGGEIMVEHSVVTVRLPCMVGGPADSLAAHPDTELDAHRDTKQGTPPPNPPHLTTQRSARA